jgi:hypothetical protein
MTSNRSVARLAMATAMAATLAACSNAGEGDETAASPDCDRACLYGFVDTYLTALKAHDPAQAALAPTVRYTENGEEVTPGSGLWETVTGTTSYEARAADLTTGEVAVLGQLEEGDNTVSYATRLKVADGVITEVETIIGRGFQPNNPSMPTEIRPGLATIVPPDQRISREQMLALVNANFDGILNDDGSHFAPDCQRIENRMPMSNNPDLDYPIATIPGVEKPHFGSMTCQEQVEHRLFDTVDSIEPRRFTVIDEEQQIVFGTISLRLYAEKYCYDVPGYGEACPPEKPDPVSLLSAEMLGVRGGKLHEVEVVFTRKPHDWQQGWGD